MINYPVYRADGSRVRKGERIVSYEGETWIFDSCASIGQITVKQLNGRRYGLFYPSIFNLRISIDSKEMG